MMLRPGNTDDILYILASRAAHPSQPKRMAHRAASRWTTPITGQGRGNADRKRPHIPSNHSIFLFDCAQPSTLCQPDARLLNDFCLLACL